MKTKLLMPALILIIAGISACVAEEIDATCIIDERLVERTTRSLLLSDQQESEHFYYYFGERIFLKQRTDKILLNFAPNANQEQLRSLITNQEQLRSLSDVSLRATPDTRLDEERLYFAILEAIDGGYIPFSTLETFRRKPEVVSASFLYQYNEDLQGLTNRFVVKLKGGTSFEQLQRLAEQNYSTIGEENRFVRNKFVVYVCKTSNLNAMQTANLFFTTGLVEYAAPIFLILNAESGSGTHFGQQWGLHGTFGIRAPQAWAITRGCPNILIAVIDDGVDLTHPDLNLVEGFDAVRNVVGGGPIRSDDNHGTPCAGVVAGRGIGISGVAPNSRIIPIRAYNRANPTYEFLPNAINEALLRSAAVITHSWSGGSPFQPFTNAINNAVENGRGGLGVIFVNNSGNQHASTIPYPANLQNVIAAGAVNSNGQRANFSNFGNGLDVVAPGVAIITTDRQGNAGYTPGSNYTTIDGTSFAAPHIAGIAALILSINPNLTGRQVRDIIERTANRILPGVIFNQSRPPNGTWNNQVGHGLVDAYAAVRATLATVPILFTTRISGPAHFCQSATYSIALPAGWSVQNWTVRRTRDCVRSGVSTTTETFATPTITLHGNWVAYSDFLEISATVRNATGAIYRVPTFNAISGTPSPYTGVININGALFGNSPSPIPAFDDWLQPFMRLIPGNHTLNLTGFLDFAQNFHSSVRFTGAELSIECSSVQMMSDGGRSLNINVLWASGATGYLNTRLEGLCGVGHRYFRIPVQVVPFDFSGFALQHNPASGTLSIEIDTEGLAAMRQTTVGARNVSPTYTIRLYCVGGNVLRQTRAGDGRTNINVADLPEGIYFLQLCDGISDRPITRSFVIDSNGKLTY